EELRHDDVAALDQSDRSGGAHGRAIPHELIDPGSGGIDYGTGADGKGLLRGGHSCEPVIAFEIEALAARARQDGRAAMCGVDRVVDHEPRVIGPTVRIDEA